MIIGLNKDDRQKLEDLKKINQLPSKVEVVRQLIRKEHKRRISKKFKA